MFKSIKEILEPELSQLVNRANEPWDGKCACCDQFIPEDIRRGNAKQFEGDTVWYCYACWRLLLCKVPFDIVRAVSKFDVTFNHQEDIVKQAVLAASQGSWVLLGGDKNGVGKTTIATMSLFAVLLKHLKLGNKSAYGRFISMKEVGRLYSENPKWKYGEFWEAYTANNIVFLLDDLGRESAEVNFAEDIVDYCYLNRLQVIATTNLSAQAFEARYRGAIISRFFRGNGIKPLFLELEGSDYSKRGLSGR